MKDHIEQRFVNLDATVVFDEAHLAKTVHEETDARAGSPDHIRESFLRNRRNQRLLFARLAELGHQQEDSRKTPLAGVEELIDEIDLDAHTAGQQVSHEHLRKSVLLSMMRIISSRSILSAIQSIMADVVFAPLARAPSS